MKKTSTLNRLLSLVLCLCMVLSLMPAIAPVEVKAAAAKELTVTIDTGASVTLKDTDGDSFYEISTADELYAFGALVNSGNIGINGVLTADIVINEGDVSGCDGIKQDGWRDWIGIGLNCDDNTVSYRGTFDGAKHTISGVYYVSDAEASIGFFDELGSEGVVKNLGVVNAYVQGNREIGTVVGDTYGMVTGCWSDATVRGTTYVGGIIGYINRDAIVAECYCMGSVSGDSSVGGIAGCVFYGTVVRCYNTGSVFGDGSSVGGIAGEVQSAWSNESYTVIITDCYNIGTVSSNGASKAPIIGRRSGNSTNITNCYYLDCGLSDSNATAKADFTSGEVAYLLGEAFGQNIDNGKTNEGHPVLGGARVYQLPSDCGSAGIGYSNNEAGQITHAYQNGICTQVPGEIHYEPAAFANNGVYQIGNAGQLFSFAELVNGGDYDATAVLTADIDLEGRAWTTICSTELYYDSTDYSESVYTGTFDGQGHVIRNYTVKGISDTKCSAGLFGTTKGATVKNLGVENMTFELNGASDVRAAAILGQMLEGTLVENCYVINSVLTPQNYIVGGIAACNYGGTIRNCFTKNVAVSGHARCGNLVSDTCGDISGVEADRPGAVINCWTDAARVAGTRSGGMVTDCHENVTDAQFASGEVAYLLGEAWGQTLGSDACPTLGGAKIYYGYTDCMDTEAEYSNAFLPARPEHRVEGGICTGCATFFEAAITHEGVTTFYENLTSLSELAAAVTEGDTIRLFVDVTVGENETVDFAAYATLVVAEGKSVTCNGTVTIGGEPGLIFENELYYYSEQQSDKNNGAFPTYWTAGEGYVIFKPATPVQEAMLILHNATFCPSIGSHYEAKLEIVGALTVQFSGTNDLTGANYYHGRVFYIQGDTTMIGIGENPVLNVQGGNDDGATAVSAGWFDGNLTVRSGTVNFRGGNGLVSSGASIERTLTVASGAVLNASGGRSEYLASVGIGVGKIVTEGCVNALVTSAENISAATYTVYGDTTLEYDLLAVFEGLQDVTFNLPAGSSLTVNEGVTLDLSGMSVDDIDLSGMVINNGTVKLPEGFRFVDRFTGGTVVTVDTSVWKTYRWNAEKNSYICADDLSHMGGNATCVSGPICELCGKEYGEKDATAHEQGTPATCQNRAVCGLCGESYGQTDKTVHDAAVDYVNGFCPNGCYEPAEQNESGFYEISNAGQLYWFADKVDHENLVYGSANAVLTDDITVNEGTVTASSTGLREWNPIGNYVYNTVYQPYQGVFDGNGKTISGLYFNDNTAYSVGVFARISQRALVKNITLVNSYFLGGMHTAGIVGGNQGVITGCVNNATIENDANICGGIVGYNEGTVELCVNTGTITSSGSYSGGVVGYNEGTVELCGNTGAVKCSGEKGGGIAGSNYSVLRNCWNTASVKVEDDLVGGIVGYHYSNESEKRALVENCWSIGDVSNGDGKNIGGVAGLSDNADHVNCYSVMRPLGRIEHSVTQSKVEQKSLDQFASGEVAYLLGDAWGQSLGSDAYPILGGAKVYYGYISCAEDAEVEYTNDATASETKPGHTFTHNGFCEPCGAYEPAALNDGVYEISNPGQLMWFAEFVNAGNFTASAVLVDDIDMDGLNWTPIGTETAYTGTLDGKGFAIKNLWQNSDGTNGNRNGLVVTLGAGGVVMGITIDNAAIWGADLYSTNAAGAIANRNYGTICDCVVKNSSIQQGAYEYLGGIAGENSGTIENCAVIGCSFTRRWGGTDSGSMGAIAQTNNGTVKNCFSYGCSFNNGRADKAAIVAVNNGTLENCYYYTTGTVATTYGTAKTAEQFASGEVAYLLGEAFGQTIGTDDYPILGGAKVYQVTNCKGETAYRNTEENGAHTEQTVTGKAPTCTETGLTDGVICSVCGETLTTQEEIPVLSHSYEDDVCTVCGHIGVPVKLDSASLSFKEKIHYNIFFSLGVDETVDLSNMGLIMFDSLNADGTMDDAIAIYSGAVEMDGKYMVATDGVPAKYMGDTIYFRAYAKLADGSYVYSKTVEYSAVTYAEHILNSDKPESAKALVVAMLNYGAAAQMFFGYNTDNLVNAFLTDEQKALPEQYRDDMANTVPVVAAEKQGTFANNKGFSKRMPAVSFEGAFEINYFFTPAYAPVDGITLYYWTEADFEANEVLTVDNATGSLKLEGTGTEQYRGDIGGIAAKNLSENIYVAAVYSDGTNTWTSGILGYSIGAYCGRLATNGGTIADLAMATAVYGYHAKAYFG